ncbi:hypothetical protein [Intestinimonas butyriciproducens]|uniref:hypothetical protein n=1 Tax=Intestinimonas butyriciproducens TaxID=1297617 RepID=UPI0018A978EB|nr:hypothetical protein [Intestinimonas butyriciproducens]
MKKFVTLMLSTLLFEKEAICCPQNDDFRCAAHKSFRLFCPYQGNMGKHGAAHFNE